jgi:hypothetical protein
VKQPDLLSVKLNRLVERRFAGGTPGAAERPIREPVRALPLLVAERIYNPSHLDFDCRVVRNFPNHVFNLQKSPDNAVLQALSGLPQGDLVPEQRWDAVLAVSLIEVASVLHAAQIFERRSYLEKWLRELGRLYDALFELGLGRTQFCAGVILARTLPETADNCSHRGA